MLHFIKKHKKALARVCVALSTIMGVLFAVTAKVLAADGDNNLISIGISTGDGSDMASVLQMLLVLTIISLAPSILMPASAPCCRRAAKYWWWITEPTAPELWKYASITDFPILT